MKSVYIFIGALSIISCGSNEGKQLMEDVPSSGGSAGEIIDSGNDGLGGMAGMAGTGGVSGEGGVAGNGGISGAGGSIVDSGNDSDEIDAEVDVYLDSNIEPCSNIGTEICPGLNCADLKIKKPSLQDGVYWIKPGAEIPPFKVYCDMTFEAKGWTLFYSSFANPCPQSGFPTHVLSGYLPADYIQALSNISTRVHIRSYEDVENKSITSVENTQSIINLRNLWVVGLQYNQIHWYGPMNYSSSLQSLGPVGVGYPNIWWAKNNPAGTVIITLSSGAGCKNSWNVGTNPDNNEQFEVYVGGLTN